MLILSRGDRFWAGDWGGGGGRNARSRGPSGGWGGEWPEKRVGERECLAGSVVEWGVYGRGERVEVADGAVVW